MASYKKISGKWSVVFDIPSADGKRTQKRLSGFAKQRDAEMAYISYKGENKEINPKGKHNFTDAYQRFINYQANRVKESTLLSIKQNFDTHVLPYFLELDVSSIRPTDIIDWQTEINSKGYSFKYKTKIIGFLKTFFNYCIEIEEIIKDNPIKKQLKFVDNKAKEEMLFYAPEEYTIFRSAITKDKDRVLFDVLYFTGMRKGELIALKWSDFNGQSFNISKTYTRKTADGSWKLTSPKTKNSYRDISLPSFLCRELIAYKSLVNAANSDFVFGDEFPTNERYLDLARDRYYKLANIKRIRIHDFRHSHVSYLISCNIDIMTISKRVGDTVETILSTYAHMLESKQTELLNKLEGISQLFSCD